MAWVQTRRSISCMYLIVWTCHFLLFSSVVPVSQSRSIALVLFRSVKFHLVAFVYKGRIFSYEIQVSIPPQTSLYKKPSNSRRSRLSYLRRTVASYSVFRLSEHLALPLVVVLRSFVVARRVVIFCGVASFASSHLQCCRAHSYSLPHSHTYTRSRCQVRLFPLSDLLV